MIGKGEGQRTESLKEYRLNGAVAESMAMGSPADAPPLAPFQGHTSYSYPIYLYILFLRGMPVTEAMAMGVPAIVTGWSGTADVVTPDVGWLVNYTLAPVRNGRGERGGKG